MAIYVNDMNLVETFKELNKTVKYLTNEFEMKDLGKTKYCRSLQIEHYANGTLVLQSIYVEEILKWFGVDKTHPLSTSIVTRSLDIKKHQFRPKEDDGMVLGQTYHIWVQ